jgi:hypothetical protein
MIGTRMTITSGHPASPARSRRSGEDNFMAGRKIDPGEKMKAVEALLGARRVGATLREAATAAGVHVATACRWQAHDPELREALAEAHRQAQVRHHRLTWWPRPRVPWRDDCPLCHAQVVVRTAPGKLTFWGCSRWPACGWESWRPRSPWDCDRCGGPRYWSHSRKSISCGACGTRICPH